MTTIKELTSAINKFYEVIRPDTVSACKLQAYPYCDYGQALLTLTTASDDAHYPIYGSVSVTRTIACYKAMDINKVLHRNIKLDWLLIEGVRKNDRHKGYVPIDLTNEDIEGLGRVVVPMNQGWIGVVGDAVVNLVDTTLGGNVSFDEMSTITSNLLLLLDIYERTDKSRQVAKNGLWGIALNPR